MKSARSGSKTNRLGDWVKGDGKNRLLAIKCKALLECHTTRLTLNASYATVVGGDRYKLLFAIDELSTATASEPGVVVHILQSRD